MENERKNNNVLLTIIGAATLLVAIVGATFAYFSAADTVDVQDITTGELKVQATSGTVSQENIKPTDFTVEGLTDEILTKNTDVAQLPITVDFTGTTIDAYYNFYLTTTNLEDLPKADSAPEPKNGVVQDINWALLSVTEAEGAKTYTKLEDGTFGGDMTNHKLLNNTESSSVESITAEQVKTLTEQASKAEKKYVLLIWIQENNEPQDELQELTINATVKVEANQAAANLPAGS